MRENPNADLPGCDTDDEGENDRSLTTGAPRLAVKNGEPQPSATALTHRPLNRQTILSKYATTSLDLRQIAARLKAATSNLQP